MQIANLRLGYVGLTTAAGALRSARYVLGIENARCPSEESRSSSGSLYRATRNND